MNTNHIAILLEVCHCQSINKASQNLFMSQPQISHIIRSVEEEIGFPIFQRTRSGVTVTPQGELYMESLRIISGEMRKIQNIPNQFQEKKDISVASIYSRFLFQAFLQFREKYPEKGTADCFTEDIFNIVIEKVVSRKVRLGIISRMKDVPGTIARQLDRFGLEIIPLCDKIPTLVYMGKKHPLAGEKELTKEQLKEQSFVYFHQSERSFLEDLLQVGAASVELLVDDRASLLEAIDSGKYISISTTSSDKVTEGDKYVYLPVKGMDYTSEICCIKPRLYELTQREKQFLQFIKWSFKEYYKEERRETGDRT